MSVRFLSGINVDSNTLFVDSTNNRVGIGTASPTQALDVTGRAYISSGASIGTTSTAGTGLTVGGSTVLLSFVEIQQGNLLYLYSSGNTYYSQIYQSGQNLILSPHSNVGIGTTSPAYKLDVSGTGKFSGDINLGSSGEHYLQNDASTTFVGLNFDSPYIRFGVNNTERMRITAAGAVAIGNAGSGGGYGIEINNSASTPRIDLVDNSNYTAQLKSNGLVVTLQNNSNNALVLGTNGTERARVTAAGNVGIGTTAPNTKLQISGENSSTASTALFSIQKNEEGYGLFSGILGSGTSWFQSSTKNESAYYALTLQPNGGNVGIGTTSPAEKLHIYGTGDQLLKVENSGTYLMYFGLASNAGYLGSTNATPLNIITNNSSRIYITTSGNVGIGTTAPGFLLHVSGSSYFDGNMGINGEGSGVTVDTGYGNNGRVGFMKYGGLEGMLVAGSDTVLRLGHRTDSTVVAGGTATIRQDLVITAAGNVGIGTTSPNGALHVASSPQTRVVIENTGNDANGAGLIMTVRSSGTIVGNGGIYVDNSNNLILYNGGVYAGNERVRINNSGYVGINTTAPSSFLTVSPGGSGNAATFTSTANAINNYVGITLNAVTVSGVEWYGSEIRNINTNGSPGFLNPRLGFFTQNASTYLPADRTEKMSILGNGYVGVGTTTPNVTLETNGKVRSTRLNAASQYLEIDGGDPVGPFITAAGAAKVLTIQNNSTTNSEIWFNQAVASHYLWLQAGTEKMRLNSSGNLGIGTTSPSYKLDVYGDIRAGGADPLLILQPNSGTYAFFQKLSASNGDYLRLYDGTTYSTFWKNGNVGIGTTSPATNLHVVGTTEARVRVSESGGASLELYQQTTDSYILSSNALRFYNGGSERMRISSAGALKLNAYGSGSNTGTATQRLAVDASGNVIEIPIGSGPVDGNGTANYVTKWSDADTITNSQIFDNGTLVGIGATSAYIDSNDRFIVAGGRLCVNALAYNAASFNRSTAGNVIDILIGGYGKGSISSDGTNLSVVALSDLILSSGSSERMRITSAGNVFFGATSAASFETFGVAHQWSRFYTTSATDYALIDVGNATTRVRIGVDSSTGGSLATGTSAYASYVGSSGAYPLQLGSYGGVAITVNSSNNVGISTTSPGAKLHVVGTGVVNIVESSNTVSYTQYYNSSTGTNSSSDGLTVGINGLDAYIFQREAANLIFGTSDTERMRITSAGNVGIGTTGPSYKLHTVVASAANADIFQAAMAGVSNGFSVQRVSSSFVYSMLDGGLGINNASPTQALHVTGNARVTGAFIDSNNEAGTSGQVLSSTGSGTDWVTPATTTASSLYDLLPAARTTYDWTVQMTSGTWADIFSSNTVLSNGTWMVQVYVSDFASGGQQYQETYSGVMSWGNANSTNQGGASAISEVVLHRSGHAANAGQFYLRTQERASSTLLLQGMVNYSHTSNTTINFKFVKVF